MKLWHWYLVLAGVFFVGWRWAVASAAGVDLGTAIRHPFWSAQALCPLSGDRARCESINGGGYVLGYAGATAGGLHPTAVPAGQAFSPAAFGPYV